MLTPFQKRALAVLERTPVFGDLAQVLGPWIYACTVRKGQMLFQEGDPAEKLFALVDGHARIYCSEHSRTSVSLDHVAPGEVVGETGILDAGPRRYGVECLENSEFAAIERRHVVRAVESDPTAGRALSTVALERMERLIERARGEALLSIEERIEQALDDLSRRLGESVGRGVQIRVCQQHLADLLGLSRSSISRVLTSPRMQHRVQLGRGRIVLLTR